MGSTYLPRVIQEEPGELTKIEAESQGFYYKPMYHQGKINHWKLVEKEPVKKDCGCRKKR